MNIKAFALTVLVMFSLSCTQQKTSRPQTALDTGREFIRASLDGKFDNAETLLLKDTQNIQLFESYKLYFNRLPETEKQHYRSAAYTIIKYVDVDDSSAIITYSNSYMHKPMDIKIVQQNGQWNIDFKFTYSENAPIN